jgi:hypothetical protein
MVPPTLTNPWWIPLGPVKENAPAKSAESFILCTRVLAAPAISYSVKVPPDRKKP